MKASTTWLNDYLDPPATAAEQGEVLTNAGFPVEGVQEVELPGGARDVRTEYEMTSNRGDCICHIGLAREFAAYTGRTLKIPQPESRATGPDAAEIISVTNREPVKCPLYTARVIRGVKVGPSPQWLADRLRAIGQIPRNNIVDATNFVLFEFGQPTHVFDLATIRGGAIIIRNASDGERFLPIGEGEKEITLVEDDLVIADAERAVAIGGVKGGAITAVTNATADILIEAATFDFVTVRNSSRRHNIVSDSSYRYERGVHPAHIEPAAQRLVQLILETAGGELCEGVVADGAEIPPPKQVLMRPDRCRALLGVSIAVEDMLESLSRLGLQPMLTHDRTRIMCEVPAHRLDIDREADLIEEVGRMYGLGNIPVDDRVAIRVAPLQSFIEGRRAVNNALVGMGFLEVVTHSLGSATEAKPFFAAEEAPLCVDPARKAENVLRPRITPSLLHVRAFNQNQGSNDLRLFESGATFARTNGTHRENRALSLLMDVSDASLGLRPLRGVVERVAAVLGGAEAAVSLIPAATHAWLEEGTEARVMLNDAPIGWAGFVKTSVAKQFNLDQRVAAAEIELEPLYAKYPPEREAQPQALFPAIERDISAVLGESVSWDEVRCAIEDLRLTMLENVMFVTVFRGKPIEDGKKSLTLRLRFRHDERTLTDEEIDPLAARAMSLLEETIGATIRK